jgi:hypothetical protein
LDDATAIQQMNQSILDSQMTLFDVRPAYRFATRMSRYGIGDKPFQGQNPPRGAIISYYLKDKPDPKTPVKMQIFDAEGKLVVNINNFPKEKGVNRVVWGMTHEGARLRRPPPPEFVEFFGGPRGPQVLPGIYTVKLSIGDKTQEKKIEVKVDPLVNVSATDLQAQLDMAMKLRDMVTTMNDSLRLLDSVKSQAEQIERVAKDRLGDLPADLTKSLADYKKQIDTLLNDLATGEEDGARAAAKFSDQLNGLFFTVSDGNAGPTPAMRENFAMLQAQLPGKVAEINKFINDNTAKINQALQKNNLPIIVAGKAIETPKQ